MDSRLPQGQEIFNLTSLIGRLIKQDDRWPRYLQGLQRHRDERKACTPQTLETPLRSLLLLVRELRLR